MITLYQRRDFGEKINATINYVTQNFRSFGTAILYIGGPAALLTGIASGIMQSSMFDLAKTADRDPGDVFGAFAGIFSGSFAFVLVFGVIAQSLISLAAYTHLKLYHERTKQGGFSGSGKPVAPAITVAEVWADMQPNIGRVIITSLLVGLATFIAALLLFIPGIYVGIVLSLALEPVFFAHQGEMVVNAGAAVCDGDAGGRGQFYFYGSGCRAGLYDWSQADARRTHHDYRSGAGIRYGRAVSAVFNSVRWAWFSVF